MNKIKGAWAAQTIGVTFGLPAEFKYNTTMIQDNQKLIWNDSSMVIEYRERPGTYDDIYMDLSFMKVIEDEGIDASAQSFAESFANASYKLWFANQTAHYNILNGLTPPESGHWLNNPCADDIDFQIEADFVGLMFPGMINSAIDLCDKVGHIMNYGDGYYGGVYVASLYSQALISDGIEDIKPIIEKAISVIPEESKFAQCINDVIKWYNENPDDWKITWFNTSRKWGVDIGSPLGVFQPFNIDAKINAAWVTVGLLYGNGDFTRTFEIATRCGDDADCNPATAGGVLAAIVGYKNIPDYWLQGLDKVDDIPFMDTDISLLQAYDMSYRHAEQMIKRGGGEIKGSEVVIKLQQAKEVPFEEAFEGHYPIGRVYPKTVNNEISFEFEGVGFALAAPADGHNFEDKNHVFETEMYIDDKLIEKAKLPTEVNKRRFTPFWRYQLPMGKHKVVIKILNPVDYARINYNYAIIYGDKPFDVKL
ncbi:MAG: ADP-ribosylglycohydrolase family protein [Draconibacterium sp.]